MALNGDTHALRLCIERLIPKAGNEAISIKLPQIAVNQQNLALTVSESILQALAGKEISIEDAKNLAVIVKQYKNELPINTLDPEIQKMIELSNRLMEDGTVPSSGC